MDNTHNQKLRIEKREPPTRSITCFPTNLVSVHKLYQKAKKGKAISSEGRDKKISSEYCK